MKVLVYDHGLFVDVAVRLARDFDTVYYFCPWAEAFPKSHKARIGQGLEGVTRVRSFWDYVDRVDLIVFPDTYNWDAVEFLKSKDYPVAGVGRAEILELDRFLARSIQRDRRLPTQRTRKMTGLHTLEQTIENLRDVYVKLNIFRGDIESFHVPSYKVVEPLLHHLAAELGPFHDSVEFVVEDGVGGVEPGFDGITFDGEIVYPTMYGYELKGGIYIARVARDEAEVPAPLRLVNNAFSSEWKRMRTRFFFSTEVRVDKKGNGYLIDMTMRLASPVPGLLQSEAIDNYSQVIYGLARGEIVTPEIKYKYLGGVSLSAPWSENHWLGIDLDEKQRKYVKLRYAAKHRGRYYAVPGLGAPVVVIGMGNTIEEVIDQVKERMNEVQAYGLIKEPIDQEKILEEIQEGRDSGIDF